MRGCCPDAPTSAEAAVGNGAARVLIQYATEIKVRAERRCGELLRVTAASGERNTGGKPSKDATVSTLADMGLTRDESSRYQQLAAMPC